MLPLRTSLKLILHSVIIATGLIALVDDHIKQRWHSKATSQGLLPRLQIVGPKTFFGALLHCGVGSKQALSPVGRPQPVRRITGPIR